MTNGLTNDDLFTISMLLTYLIGSWKLTLSEMANQFYHRLIEIELNFYDILVVRKQHQTSK